MKNKIDRNIIPQSDKPNDVHFPEYNQIVSEKGSKIFIINDSRFPIITFRIIFKRGAILDRNDNIRTDGLSNFLADMLFKGTEDRKASEISRIIDSFGASVSSGSDYDYNFITFHCLKKYFRNMMELIYDIMQNSIFPEEEIERMKLQKINTLYSLMDSGEYLASKKYKEIIYGSSPYSVCIEGTMDSIQKIDREKLFYAYNNFLLNAETSVCFIGDITSDEDLQLPELFGNENGNAEIDVPEMPSIDKTKIYIIERKSAVQSDIIMGNNAIRRNHPDFIGLKVMNTALGGYFTSRINTNLREVNGFTYGAKSQMNSRKYQGDILIDTNVKNDLTGDAIREIIKEIKRMQDELMSEDELQSVKNYIIGTYPMQLETPNSIASKILALDLYDIDEKFYNTYISEINSITPQIVRQMAQKHLKPDNLVISVCGNTNDIIKSVEKALPDIEIIKQEKK